MIQNQQKRRWILLAAVAIGFALVLLIIPHGHSISDADWLAILPIFFVGIISPLSLLAPLAYVYIGRTPDAPVLPTSFQRPPPFRLA